MGDEDVPPSDDVSDEAADEQPPSPTPPAAPVEEDWASRFKYLLADFENFRKRSAKEHETTRQQMRAAVIGSLLPVHEAAAKASEAVGHLPPADPVRRGVELLGREWQAFLDREGVVPVAQVGSPFHAEWHEAVDEAPTRPGAADGTVLEIVQQGYRMGTVLLRPAKVVVARAAPAGRKRSPAAEAAVGPESPESM